jgi:sugar-phosphatase
MKTYAALLFDMDGTLLSSIAAAERIWKAWCEKHGVDFEVLRERLHGVRASDTIRSLGLEGIDVSAEARSIGDAEIRDVEGVVPIAGAVAFVASLPPDRWALVTSAPRALAESRMRAAGVPMPRVVVTAEDVANGKPAPDCFIAAAERLGVDVRACLIFEDSPAGIAAARATGGDVVIVSASHDYGRLSVRADSAGITLSGS